MVGRLKLPPVAPVILGLIGLAFALAGPSGAETHPSVSAAAPSSTVSTISATEPGAPGSEAPEIELKALDGTMHRLSDFRGATVVLEWFNPDCPFVKYAHKSGGPLNRRAKLRSEQGVQWLANNSGAPGKQGADPERNRRAVQEWGLAHPVLLDPEGTAGRAFGAKTTPQMVVIDTLGIIRYNGALDSAPLGRGAAKGVDYLKRALDSVLANETVSSPRTKPYGCSVKY